jgi:hypothetical protein|tara:strand:- start:5417 stop:6286 length:870 start_codon:yes stop_codon:yes gene_type:complete
MKAQVTNNMMASFLAFLDNRILSSGEAYTNHGSNFYPLGQDTVVGYTIWGAPFKQMVCDASITGATPFNGISIDGVGPYAVNSNGIKFFQHHQGQVFFEKPSSSTPASVLNGAATVSGNYSVKDFNTYLTSEPEEELLFKTKFELSPRTTQTVTGLASEAQTYPAIFLKDNGGLNVPFAMGGLDNTILNVRAIVLADSAFKLDAVCSIMRDCNNDKVALMEASDFPFNAIGACTGSYNYETLAASKENAFFVDEVNVSKTVPNRGDYADINTEVFSAFADFELSLLRMT